jgi:[protein-PII] uridylyltransferase
MADELRLLLNPPAPGRIRMRFDDGSAPDPVLVTFCIPDRPGTLAKAAGVLALNRIGVLRAQTYSTSTGLALQRFVVQPSGDTDWNAVATQMEACLAGRVALDPLLANKILDYHPGRSIDCEVRVLEGASAHSSVIEVRTRDALGVLYAVAAGITDLDLDIHVAKIDTKGERVVDVFYVRTNWGSKLDASQGEALARSVDHRLNSLFNRTN